MHYLGCIAAVGKAGGRDGDSHLSGGPFHALYVVIGRYLPIGNHHLNRSGARSRCIRSNQGYTRIAARNGHGHPAMIACTKTKAAGLLQPRSYLRRRIYRDPRGGIDRHIDTVRGDIRCVGGNGCGTGQRCRAAITQGCGSTHLSGGNSHRGSHRNALWVVGSQGHFDTWFRRGNGRTRTFKSDRYFNRKAVGKSGRGLNDIQVDSGGDLGIIAYVVRMAGRDCGCPGCHTPDRAICRILTLRDCHGRCYHLHP